MKRIGRSILAAAMAAMVLAVASPAAACVGKTLVVGYKATPQQEILAQVLAILITERTGTTVKTARYESTDAIHQALLKADLDLYVEYTGVGQVEILQRQPVAEPQALYQAVKEVYNQDLNLIWLEPLGFEAAEAVPPGVPAQAAPVVRKDTLKKFPALARLINKLGGAIDAAAIRDLEGRLGKQSAPEVARDFLKAGKFI